ncbi:hypothetical protein VC83_04093 [Pseudogymnoascus destructans]|uniref:Uncharacterized protein n=1 Tax=Pseudogymnoascus destructans TaxID=655981 RepID=A0A177ADK6_9PEZI|nr:uncharacterized protein VC83_04093 [Pseudogymnoascus destructans]OAF59512.1 hypothetical protein VC83_04093 [Pseudogymnoascus destructans]
MYVFVAFPSFFTKSPSALPLTHHHTGPSIPSLRPSRHNGSSPFHRLSPHLRRPQHQPHPPHPPIPNNVSPLRRRPHPHPHRQPPPRQPDTASLPLRALISKLTSLTSTSHSLCHTIRSTRRLSPSGTATTTLAALESSLADALPRLSNLYASLRATHGKPLDIADAPSLAALDAAVNTLNKHVKARLANIADSRAGSKSKSGFKEIGTTFNAVIDSAEDALTALSGRLSAASAPAPAPRPEAAPIQEAPHRPHRVSRTRESEPPRVLERGEIAITYRQFERMDAVMQSCWTEEAAEGGRRFRNVADPSRVVYGVVPEGGFVRVL